MNIRKRGVLRTTIVLIASLGSVISARCQNTGSGSNAEKHSNFFDAYFARVDATQAAQPHWITPVATTTPRLEEEFRTDVFWQTNNSGVTTENYGGSKGLELIPLKRVEVILKRPALSRT